VKSALNPCSSVQTRALPSVFLARHPQVRIHYSPTYSSLLNQVEIWFSKIQRDLIARGIFTSLKDLDRKIMRYIRSYNRKAIPIKWSTKMLPTASNPLRNQVIHCTSP